MIPPFLSLSTRNERRYESRIIECDKLREIKCYAGFARVVIVPRSRVDDLEAEDIKDFRRVLWGRRPIVTGRRARAGVLSEVVRARRFESPRGEIVCRKELNALRNSHSIISLPEW
jgi:hypothetical protein